MSSPSISSLGVGSGLDLESIVSALVEAKKTSKQNPVDKKQTIKELEVSGLGTLKSSLKSFQDYLDDIQDGTALNKRKVSDNLDEDDPAFSYELGGNVTNTSHEIAVTQLAQGTKLVGKPSSDSFFSETYTDDTGSKSVDITTYRTKLSGKIDFTLGSGDDAKTFSVQIDENESLETIVKKVNEAENNPGVSLNYIIGADGSINFSLESNQSGDGNDLRLSGDVGILGMAGDGSSNEIQKAQNAYMTVDGVSVTSTTNKFSDQVSGIKFTANKVSEKDDEGNFKTSSLKISEDNDSLKSVINNFVSKFNGVLSTCDDLYKRNTFTNGKNNYDGGDLAGDSICTDVKSKLKNVANSYVSSYGKTLYEYGISINSDGKLEVDNDKLTKTLDNNYDQFISVMKDLSEKLDDSVETYTKKGSGILAQRTDSANAAIDSYKDRLNSIKDYMDNYEKMLRKKYTSLDTMLADMNSSISYIQSILG